jgi:hypothetical protein
VPESTEVLALVEQGYLRMTDIAPILGVTKQPVSQIVTDDLPEPAQQEGVAAYLFRSATTRSRVDWRRNSPARS